MSELLGGSALKNYPKLRARLEVRQHIAPSNLWHWSVIYDNGHTYYVSDSFESMASAITDAAGCGALTLQRAIHYPA